MPDTLGLLFGLLKAYVGMVVIWVVMLMFFTRNSDF